MSYPRIRRSTFSSCIIVRPVGRPRGQTKRRRRRLGADRRHDEEDFPDLLPKREYMERAKKIWEDLRPAEAEARIAVVRYSLGEMPTSSSALASLP